VQVRLHSRKSDKRKCQKHVVVVNYLLRLVACRERMPRYLAETVCDEMSTVEPMMRDA
jgi:hypothetical protein